MAPVRSRIMKGGKPIIIDDVAIKDIDNYLTISELIDALRYATGRSFLPETILYWIYSGNLRGHKAGDGRTAAWLIHKDTARRFVDHMRRRHGGELLTAAAACALLGELIGREGPISLNTLTAWRRNKLIYPADEMSVSKYARAEIEDFAAWFNRVKVWRWGRWALPTRARREFYWEDPETDQPVEVGKRLTGGRSGN